MNILITGIHGFVGSNLVKALSKENTIYGLDIVSPQKDGVELTFSWDDLNKNIIPQIDAIIHLAGVAHTTEDRKKEKYYFEINEGLTKRIVDFFISRSIKKFIFFSSVKAVAETVKSDYLTEDVIPRPKGLYGESKMAAERYIYDHLDKAELNNQSVYILRPCMIHGPGNKGNLNLLYNFISKGIPWPLGAFENKRTFTSIDNVCFIINSILTKPIESGIYNIGDDQSLSTNEIIEIICYSLGKRPHIWHVNKTLMSDIARIGTFLHLPLNNERLRKLTENYKVSNKKIKNAIGSECMPTIARDGLIKTFNSFKKH